MIQNQVKQTAAEIAQARRALEAAERNYISLSCIVSWVDPDTYNLTFGTYQDYLASR